MIEKETGEKSNLYILFTDNIFLPKIQHSYLTNVRDKNLNLEKMMKAIFIDAVNKTIERIDFEGDYKDIQNKISVDCFTCVDINPAGDAVYVDDEGLINGTDDFFFIEGMYQPIAGNGLILGTDMSTGDSDDAACFDSFDDSTVSFMNRMEIAIMCSRGEFA